MRHDEVVIREIQSNRSLKVFKLLAESVGQPREAAAKAEFADEPDAWIIAYAGAKNLTVVTQEVYSGNIKRKIPIPNVCMSPDIKVPCIDVFTMLTRLGVQFGVLDKK